MPGPIFLLCGQVDLLWPSCTFATDITTRRVANHTAYPDTTVIEADAGHFVASPVPSTSGGTTTQYGTFPVGGTPQTDALGRLDAWPRLLAFLANLTTAQPAVTPSPGRN